MLSNLRQDIQSVMAAEKVTAAAEYKSRYSSLTAARDQRTSRGPSASLGVEMPCTCAFARITVSGMTDRSIANNSSGRLIAIQPSTAIE